MSDTKFTKGDWSLEYDEDSGDFVLSMDSAIEDPSSFDSAHQITLYERVYEEEGEEQFSEIEANAKLIVASPDLYDALKTFVDGNIACSPRTKHVKGHMQSCRVCIGHAALAKARGETCAS